MLHSNLRDHWSQCLDPTMYEMVSLSHIVKDEKQKVPACQDWL